MRSFTVERLVESCAAADAFVLLRVEAALHPVSRTKPMSALQMILDVRNKNEIVAKTATATVVDTCITLLRRPFTSAMRPHL